MYELVHFFIFDFTYLIHKHWWFLEGMDTENMKNGK